jgi:Holliday junction resolvase
MKAARVDRNHAEIVAALRKVGATVQSLATAGRGVPDLLVGFRGTTYLLEIKDGAKAPSKKALNDEQIAWHGKWRGGPLAIVDSVDAALRAIKVTNE